MRPHILLSLCASLLFSSPHLVAQGLPEAPSQQHRFWDRPNTSLFIVHSAIEASDFALTHYNLANGGRETNPLGSNLCESGTAGQVTFFAARTAGTLVISYVFHKTKHHRLERAITMFMISDSAYGVAYSLAHRE